MLDLVTVRTRRMPQATVRHIQKADRQLKRDSKILKVAGGSYVQVRRCILCPCVAGRPSWRGHILCVRRAWKSHVTVPLPCSRWDLSLAARTYFTGVLCWTCASAGASTPSQSSKEGDLKPDHDTSTHALLPSTSVMFATTLAFSEWRSSTALKR